MTSPTRRRALPVLVLALAAVALAPADAFQPSPPAMTPRAVTPSFPARTRTHALGATNDGREDPTSSDRRGVLRTLLAGGLSAATATGAARPSHALVEGNVPPTKSKSLSEEYRQGTAALGESVEAEVLPREAYKKLPSGVIYADIAVGSGDVVQQGSKVNCQWVLRKSNGYFVDSSAASDSVPFIFAVGDPAGAIAGIDEGMRGMQAGGTRRILIPPSLAWVEGVGDGKPGPVPAGFGPRQQMRRVMEVRRDVPGEYIFLEVKATRVR